MEYKIINEDSLEALKKFPDKSIDCIMTSPPYWGLRDYGESGQIGLEKTFDEYINNLCDIFDEVKRILKDEGTCWVNVGDTYSGSGKGAWKNKNKQKEVYVPDKKPDIKESLPSKTLCMIPERFAIEMVRRGWILRNQIIWHKPNAMPSPVKDRFTVDFEKLFFFVKNKKYYFETQREPHNPDSIKRACRGRKSKKLDSGQYSSGYKEDYRGYDNIEEDFRSGKLRGSHPDGRNVRTTWSISTKPFKGAHFAVFPEQLVDIPLKAGCPINGFVLDIFMGSGTTGVVALKQNKRFIGIDLNSEYCDIAKERLKK